MRWTIPARFRFGLGTAVVLMCLGGWLVGQMLKFAADRHRAFEWRADLDRRGIPYWGEPGWLGVEPSGADGQRTADDDNLARLAGGESLEVLVLSDSAVTDVGLRTWPPAPRLRLLYLSNTRITDAGIAALARHPALEEIHLDGTGLGDAGLNALAGFPALRAVYVQRTAVTDEGLAALRARAPHIDCLR